jgi:GT2 family glycosyltransferase
MDDKSASSQQVTILIPQYKTFKLTKLCLRLIKKHTDLNRIKVIAIDNNSADESVEYLRSVKWIKLIERKSTANEDGPSMHSKALDMGLAQADTPFVLSIHTDTFVTSNKWLDFLLGKIQASEKIGGVGSWKLEQMSDIKKIGKAIERFFQTKIIHKKNHRIEGLGDNYLYLRSHCALYRTDAIRKCNTCFSDGDIVAGKVLHKKLFEAGYEMIFLPSEELINYIKHLNHATMILNPELGGRRTGTPKEYNRIMKELNSLNFEQILKDSSLD